MKPSDMGVTYSLFTSLSPLQILTQLLMLAEVPWPSYFVKLVTYMDAFNLSFLPKGALTWHDFCCYGGKPGAIFL